MKAGRPLVPTVDEYRRMAGWSVRQLADKAGFAPSLASQLCNGKRVTEASARKLEAISGIPWERWMMTPPVPA